MVNRTMFADAHCDFLYGMRYSGFDAERPAPAQQISLQNLRRGNVRLQYFAAWIDRKLKTSFLQQTLLLIDAYYRLMTQCAAFVPFRRGFDFSGDTVGTVLSVEGGEALEGSLENLRVFWLLGVRALALTWNHKNDLACPAMGRDSGGLTSFGVRALREMERVGIAPDISHLNDRGIDDVLRAYSRPIMASHSNARSICNHPRNLTDAQIRAIIHNDGYIGVSFYNTHINAHRMGGAKDVAMHVRHIAELGGIRHVGFGADFDGMGGLVMPELSDSGSYPQIEEELAKMGFTQADIRAVAFDNLLRFTSFYCK